MSNKVFRVARKEFLDTVRDRRSLIRMMIIPLLAFPIIINLVVNIQSSLAEKAASEELEIGYMLNGQDPAIIDSLESMDNFKFTAYEDSNVMRDDVKEKTISMGLIFNRKFDTDFNDNKTSKLNIIYRQADQEEYGRMTEQLDKINEKMIENRLVANNLSTELTQAFDYKMPVDTATMTPEEIKTNMEFYNVSELKEVIGKYAGGMLPYIFIAFCFMGCMYPAIDLFAGEKERGTMETLLTTPVRRTQILLGKMLVIVTFGLLSATLALVGLFASMNMVDMDGDLMMAINSILTPQLMLTLYMLLIPLTIFFAGVLTPISIYSKSYKEAQSTMVPLNIVMVLPAIAGFIPSIELDYVTAFIPIVNVVLATKQIIAGTMDPILIAITFTSLILIAGIAVAVSYKQFGKESNILRGE